MDILSYLSELIQTRKIIGISGLGTIYKKKSPGRYDVETHSFVPPSYTLDFTEEIKEDILLPDFISKERNVSTETALYFINEFSADIHQQLKKHEEAELGVLGRLKKVSGKTLYEPSRGLNFGFDFYGLPSIKANPFTTEKAQAIIADTEQPLIVEEKEQVAIAQTDIQEQDNLFEETPGDPAETAIITSEETAVAIPEQETLIEAVLPVADDAPTVESIVADNQISEENPGDTAPEHDIEEVVNQETANATDKETEQLYAKLEALNSYRAKSPHNISAAQQEEVIWNLKKPAINEAEPVTQYHTLPDVPPDPEVEKTTSLTVKILIVIAVLLALVTTAYFLRPDLFSGITGNTPKQVKPAAVNPTTTVSETTTPLDSTLVQDSTNIDSATINTTNKPEVTTTDNLKQAAVPTRTDSVLSYEIIGASVLNQKEADYFIYQMKKSGVKAKVIPGGPGKRLKMSLATFKDKAAAELELERLDEKLNIKGIYIYKNKQQ